MKSTITTLLYLSLCCFLITVTHKPACALDIQVPDFQASSARCNSGLYIHLFEHLNQLSRFQVYKNITGAAIFPNTEIFTQLKCFHLHLGNNARDWNIYAELNDLDALHKWWHKQMRGLQKVIRGFGIQRNGMRIGIKDSSLRIEGLGHPFSDAPKDTTVLLPQWGDSANDIYITHPQLGTLPLRFNKEGIECDFHVAGTPQTRYLDSELLQRLPMDIFCWVALVVDTHSRPSLLACADGLQTQLAAYGDSFSDQRLQRILTACDGTILIGLSLSKKSTDINMVWARNPLVDAECEHFAADATSIISSNNRSIPDLVVIKGDKYWALSSNINIAQHLSGKRTVHFPQRLPPSLANNARLKCGFYANTVALAQSYYAQIQKFHRQKVVANQRDQDDLQHSLEQLIPYLRPAHGSISVNQDATGWDIQGHQLGMSACMLSGHFLKHGSRGNSTSIRKKLLAVYRKLNAIHKKNKAWPQQLPAISGLDSWMLCYLQPRNQDNDSSQHQQCPMILASPALNGGASCLVIHSNGTIGEFPGRGMWQRGLLLEKRGTGTDQWDWIDVHPELKWLQPKLNNAIMNNKEIQLLLQQIEFE